MISYLHHWFGSIIAGRFLVVNPNPDLKGKERRGKRRLQKLKWIHAAASIQPSSTPKETWANVATLSSVNIAVLSL